MIQLFSNTLGKDELAAVEQVFKSRWVGRGKECEAFEQEFARHIGVRNILLFNSCTAATYTLLRALNIGPGHEVIIPTVQFLGVANAIQDCGAQTVFADVDEHTLNILPSEIDRLRTKATKAVFLLHYGGHPAMMNEILEASQGILVLEDAANAVSSNYYGFSCGTIGDGGVWSFDAMKELVMVDGGALWMKSQHDREWAEVYRYFGLPKKDASGVDASAKRDRWWEFEIRAISGRHISNDVLAAIGRVQLKRLEGFICRRRIVWERYQVELAGIAELALPPEPAPVCESSYYLYWVQTDQRSELARYLLDNGVYTTFRYYPLHLVEGYRSDARLQNAERIAERTLCLPLHQNLTDSNASYIVDKVRGFFGR